ncbi:universal stress protein UspA [Rhodovibrio sodomensis]|uniref:Universal stress protein UspA n=1 Tax=Rhodovibrio sodomensis TaxID=1088 RepID=A0ABS1DCS4_9PROT|nr:universal stress protein [Rhodovibrio sodomensis]MBK1667716.1 universal stress protein UspA [Rhodovibrio sodomensis]
MTQKLIALVDGSPYSRSVCDAAAWIAQRAGLAVELMHVLGRREGGKGSDLSGSIALGARSALLRNLTELDEQRAKLAAQHGRAILEDALALLKSAGVDATPHLRHGDVVEAITEKEAGSDLVVVGKRGEAAASPNVHLGSHLERAMRSVSKPLFVAAETFHPIERVLVAYDGSPSAMRAVDYLARSPVYAGLKTTVVTFGEDTEANHKLLDPAKAVLAGAGIEAATEVRAGQPDQALGGLVAEDAFDHLVMGSSGHTRFRAFFAGSTTMEMLRVCPVPILLVK